MATSPDTPEARLARQEAGTDGTHDDSPDGVAASAELVLADTPRQPRRYGRPGAGDGRNAMVASAARIPLNDRRAIQNTQRRRQAWQTEAWDYFDEVGEIGYTCTFLANLMSKLVLYPAVRPTPGAAPIPIDADGSPFPDNYRQIAIDTLDRLRSVQGGQAAILRELSLNLEVAGECYLHGHMEAAGENDPDQDAHEPEWEDPDAGDVLDLTQVEDWQIRSVDELAITGEKFALRRGPGIKTMDPLPDGDLVIRIWERHPRFSEMATCSMRRVLAEAEALLLLSRAVRATTKSRLSNGILLVPSELSFGPVDPTRDSGDGEETDDPFDAELAESMTTPIQEEGSASAVVPMVIRGPGEHLDKVRHLALDKTLDPVLDAMIEQRILRIARGLNMPVEVTTGMMGTTFANAVQIKRSEFEDHVEPRAILVVDAITGGYYQWALEMAGVPPEVARTVFVWYNADALIQVDDQSEKSEKAHADGIISDEARRRYSGFTEEDKPEDDEILRRLLLKGGRMDPTIEGYLFRATNLAPDAPIPAPAAGVLGDTQPVSAMPAPGAPTAPPAAPVAAAGTPSQWAKLGPKLTAIDRELRTRTIAKLDEAMRTALERAGNRIKARAQRAQGGGPTLIRQAANGAAPHEVAAKVGKPIVEQIGLSEDSLLEGAFANALETVTEWMRGAHAQAVQAVERASGTKIAPPAAEQMAQRFETDLAAAREWLMGNLMELAAHRLYDPTPGTPVGEHDGTVLVPASLVRAAIAVAGGQAPAHGGTMLTAGAWMQISGGPVTAPDGDPVGGIGTGPTVMGLVTGQGGSTQGWQWEYGAGVRSEFKPHLDLDGTVVEHTDDPEWANTGGWPGTSHYFPGDHEGCVCDITPILIGPMGDTRTETPEDLANTDTADVGPAETSEAETSEAAASDDIFGGYEPSTLAPGELADSLGYATGSGDPTPEEVKAAERQVKAVRDAVKAEAKELADTHYAWLVDNDMYKLAPITDSQEDWYWKDITKAERSRLRTNGWVVRASHIDPDSAEMQQVGVNVSIVEDKMRTLLGDRDASVDPMAQWVKETRLVDAARAISKGSVDQVSLARYGNVDFNAIVDSPYDLTQLFRNQDFAALEIARVNAAEASDEAAQLLGRAVLGPAPYQMTEQEYLTEILASDAQVAAMVPTGTDEWTGAPTWSETDQAVLDRRRELLPDGIDDGTQGYDQIYRDILKVAREGDLI